MLRQNIILGNYTYIVDFYEAGKDLKESHYEKFYIIKKNRMMNSIMFDTDIMFISKNIIEKSTKENNIDIDFSELSKSIVFPITENNFNAYSKNFKKFNEAFNENTFLNDQDYSDLMKLYDNNENEINILCDKIRIYIPITNRDFSSIIDVENLINDIRYHYICQKSDSLELNSDTEITINNIRYSQYIEAYIPNTNFLFRQSNVFIKERYNFSQIKQKIKYDFSEKSSITLLPTTSIKNENDIWKKSISVSCINALCDKELYVLITNNDNIDVNKFNQIPLKEKEEDQEITNYKIICNKIPSSNNEEEFYDGEEIINYNNNEESSEIILNYISNTFTEIPINDLTIDYDQEQYIYLIENTLDGFKLIGKNNIVSGDIIIKNNEDEINLYTSLFLNSLPFFLENVYDGSVTRIERVFYDVTQANPSVNSNPLRIYITPFENYNDEMDLYEISTSMRMNADVFNYDNKMLLKNTFEFVDGEQKLSCVFLYPGYDSKLSSEERTKRLNEYYLEKSHLSLQYYKSFNIEDNELYDEDIYSPHIDKTGFIVEISTDINFKNIVLSYEYNLDIDKNDTVINEIDFSLDFGSSIIWDAYPEKLLIRSKFIDKIAANVFESNSLVITKDIYKYMVLKSSQEYKESPRLNLQDINRINDLGVMNNTDYFNFIDKINCTIVNTKETDKNNSLENPKTNAKIIFKPIFYKVQALPQLKIKANLTQNIGLNLAEMISKVESFKLVLDGKEYVEYARNDGYVIFRINSQDFKSANGDFNLLNQDGEFINDGTWYIY
jgi:hypothetical protein